MQTESDYEVPTRLRRKSSQPCESNQTDLSRELQFLTIQFQKSIE